MLGKNFRELEERFLRYLDADEKKTLQALALAGTFDEPLFRALIERKVIQKYAVTDFPQIVGGSRSYVTPAPDKAESYIFHRHMSDALVKSLSDLTENRQSAERILKEILACLEARFHVEKLADFTSTHFAVYSQAFQILYRHSAETGFLKPEFVCDKFLDWTSLLGSNFYSEARGELARPIVKYLENTLGPDHPGTLSSLHNLAALLNDKGDLAGAEELFRKAFEERKRTLGSEHPDTLQSLNNLAVLLYSKGDLAGAEPRYREALEAMKRTLGPEHPNTLKSLNNLAALLHSKGDLAGAEPLYRQALEARERTLGPEHPDTLLSLSNLAILLYSKGDLAGAEPLFRRALEGRKRTLGSEHPDTLLSLSNLAVLLEDKGDLAE
jgi:tetratricopeptide (TPR) repeat protein